MRTHLVRQGEHLNLIAWRSGVEADAIWQHSANRALREQRQPNMLRPGDILQIPDRVPNPMQLQKGGSNRFVSRAPRTPVRVRLRDAEGAISGARFVIEGVPGPTIEGTSDGNGVASFELPMEVEHAELVLPDRSLRFPVRVGHLNPSDDQSGIRARLTHLGYMTPEPDTEGARPEDALRRGIAAFQRDIGREATGDLDQETHDALIERHGS